MKRANAVKINSDTYRFTESAFGVDVYMYLLIGHKNALLIDTGYGFTDVPAAIRGLTDLPLIVVNTHGHFDHTHGNHLYSESFLSAKDDEVFKRHNDRTYMKNIVDGIARQNHIPKFLMSLPTFHIKDVLSCQPSVHKALPEKMFLDLGERKVTFIETPGHTAGSICILDEKYKWLFGGDTCCAEGVLLNFAESTSVEEFQESIQHLKNLAASGAFTKIYPGHQITPVTPDILESYNRECIEILSGKAEQTALSAGMYCNDGPIITFIPEQIFRKNKKCEQ